MDIKVIFQPQSLCPHMEIMRIAALFGVHIFVYESKLSLNLKFRVYCICVGSMRKSDYVYQVDFVIVHQNFHVNPT